MKYYANKICDLYPLAKGSSGKYTEMMNITSFETPEIEFGDGEISGAGVLGTVNVPDFSAIENPEAKLTGKTYNDLAPAFNPLGCDLKLNWAIDNIGADSTKTYTSYTAYIKGSPKNIPGGEKKKGEGQELEQTFSVTYYKLVENGKTITEYNPLANVLIINGVDVVKDINRASSRI